jgi:hypothetical protein
MSLLLGERSLDGRLTRRLCSRTTVNLLIFANLACDSLQTEPLPFSSHVVSKLNPVNSSSQFRLIGVP